jgi:uncharacterized protein YbaP (TraB family)
MQTIRKADGRLRRLAAGLLALLAACAPNDAPPSRAAGPMRPALWQVADADTTIYLFGTIHLLPAGTQWRSAELDRALAEADSLVVEVVSGDPVDVAAVRQKLATSPGLPPLAERIPEAKRATLARMISETGLPAASLDKMETWAAALTLAGASLARMGFRTDLGVEQQLALANKPTAGLETLEQQLGFFDTLSEEAQRALLAGVLAEGEATRAAFQKMLAAWLAGDVDAIAQTFNSEANFSPELRDALMRRRNRNWADWIARRLDQPGTVLVAVGAGHLAGADSVQRMLRSKGLKAKRIR